MENNGQQEDRLYAGKFKSVDELEKGYKESLSVHLRNKELESKVKSYENIPSEYQIPVGIELPKEKILNIESLARESALTQEQFSRAVKKASIDYTNENIRFKEKMAEIGEQNINKVSSYIDKNYSTFSEEFRSKILRDAVNDSNFMKQIMEDRNMKLNDSVPGMNNMGQTQDMSTSLESELKDAARDAEKNRHDIRAQNRVIELANQLAEARKHGRKYNSY